MADPLSAVAAAAQLTRYAFALFEAIQKVTYAKAIRRKHLRNVEELVEMARAIEGTPALQTAEVAACTGDILSFVRQSRLNPELRRGRLRFTLSLVFNEKQYGELFSDLERKKSTLLIFINTVQAGALAVQTVTLDEIRTDFRTFSRQNSMAQTIDPSPQTTLVGKQSYQFRGNMHVGEGATVLGIRTGRGRGKLDGLKDKHLSFHDNMKEGTRPYDAFVLGQQVHDRAAIQDTSGHWSGNKLSGKGDMILGFDLLGEDEDRARIQY